jgi:isopentenyl-diphosphate Delta-isomerase
MNDALETVVLVDIHDREVGTAPKLEVHRRGDLHRAFSVLIGDGAGNMLLQKRHPAKYHSGGLWTNACCGHPRRGESAMAAARRRLAEEMGIDCELHPVGTLTYRADVGDGLIEHEFVHLFAGVWSAAPRPDPREIEDYDWRARDEVRREVVENPERFTAWFRRYLDDPVWSAVLAR